MLLAVAVILFVLAALGDAADYADYLAWGLAAFAAAFLLDELGLGSRIDKRR